MLTPIQTSCGICTIFSVSSYSIWVLRFDDVHVPKLLPKVEEVMDTGKREALANANPTNPLIIHQLT